MSENKEKRPFGFKDKIGYMFGDFGNDFSFLFASNYLMVFYTKVLGLSGFVVGLLFMGTRIVDAFTDVTMGRIVDHMQPAKDGRFRPWIRRMCIPVAVEGRERCPVPDVRTDDRCHGTIGNVDARIAEAAPQQISHDNVDELHRICPVARKI